MSTEELKSKVEAVLDQRHGGYVASAAKRGRNPQYPYVPLVKTTDNSWRGAFGGKTSNPCKGFAYATRDEAVAKAQECLDVRRAAERDLFLDPRRGRAMRRYYGLPENI